MPRSSPGQPSSPNMLDGSPCTERCESLARELSGSSQDRICRRLSGSVIGCPLAGARSSCMFGHAHQLFSRLNTAVREAMRAHTEASRQPSSAGQPMTGIQKSSKGVGKPSSMRNSSSNAANPVITQAAPITVQACKPLRTLGMPAVFLAPNTFIRDDSRTYTRQAHSLPPQGCPMTGIQNSSQGIGKPPSMRNSSSKIAALIIIQAALNTGQAC